VCECVCDWCVSSWFRIKNTHSLTHSLSCVDTRRSLAAALTASHAPRAARRVPDCTSIVNAQRK